MRLSKTISAAALCCLLAAPAGPSHARPGQGAPLPDTPAGRQLKDWLRVFALGDQDGFARFIAARYAPPLLAQEGAVDRADRQARIYTDARGFEVRRVEKSSPGEVAVLARASLTGLWYRLVMRVEAEPPHRVRDYTAQRAAPPDGPRRKPGALGLVNEVGLFMDRLAAADAFSGALLVAKDGRPILRRAYGLASKAHRAPNRADTKFNVASVGKVFTAVAVMQLIERGKLSLDDTVGKLLPDYPNRQVAAQVTVRHLLSHSSGMGDVHGAEYVCRKGVLRRVRDYFPLFADAPLSFEPGQRMQYSNAGYILLGAIVEQVSGEDYFEYVRRHIFGPAGMADTDFYEADSDTPNLATGYTNFEDLGGDQFRFRLGPRRNTTLYGGAKGNPQGGAFSTADDLLRFARALRGHRLLRAESLASMTSAKFFFRRYAAGDVYYGYGFELENVGGRRVVGHGGGDLGISAAVRWYPDSGNYTVVVLSNYDRGGIIAIDKLQELITRSR